LIVNEQTGEIIALPLEKFFNLGETIVAGVVASVKPGPFQAFVKEDGSLGIGYRLDGKFKWATRGSFDSPQAAVAQTFWDAKYQQHDVLLATEWNHLTLMAEIISKDTRQVVNYPFEDLVLLAARNRFTGADIAYDELTLIGERLGMRVVERLESSDLDALLRRAEQLDGNHEGFVLQFADGSRVKVKGEEYKRLHRLLSGINAKTLAEAWFDGTIGELLRIMPEEFRVETEALVRELDAQTVAKVAQFEAVYAQARELTEKKAFVEWARNLQDGVRETVFARRKFDEQYGVSGLVRAAIANAVVNEHETGDVSLDRALEAYEEMLTDYLWDNTRDAQLRADARKVAQAMPQPLRSVFESVIVSLQPELLVEKARAFVRRSQDVAELRGLDVDAVFARAPSPDSAVALHKEWVFSSPLQLRGFLDQWRYTGQMETASIGARKLLSAALRLGLVPEYLAAVSEQLYATSMLEGIDLEAKLNQLHLQLEAVWNSLPHESGPGSVAESALDVENGWGRALLSGAWASQRTQVRDAYIASSNDDRSGVCDDE
jgi:RNA ligase